MRLRVIMKRYKSYFNEDITIDFIPILNKVVKSYISKNRDNNFFTGDCANFAEALFKFIQYNEIIHNLKEDKDYYIVTMSDNSVSHTVLFIKGKYIDASGINTKNQIKDKFATGDGKVVWEKDEGIYNNSGVSSTKILNGLEDEFEKFYPDLSSKLSEDITITETPEFKKWFGNSKVVKGDKPLVVYHGGNRKFDTFSYKYMGDTDDLFLGAGFYFSSSKKIARGYGSKIIECYLSIKNPLIIEDSYSFGGVHPDKIKEILGLSLKATPKNIWDELKKQGYDGVIVNSGSNKMVEIVALKPNQIKSATNNNGEFSLQSNNIYESKFNEDIIIPLEKGDSFYYGKFKNKQAIYDSHYFNDKGDLVIKTPEGKEIPMCKIRLIQENKELIPIKKNDVRDAYKFLSDYSDLPEYVFLNSVKKGIYKTLKIKDLLLHSNHPWDNKRRPSADSRLNNTIILAHIKSNIGKSNPDYYLIVDGNHRVIQHINLNIPTINCFIVECPYLFLNKRKIVTYDKDALQEKKFSENLRFSDLQKHAGASDFTKDWIEVRRKIKGPGNKSAKLKSMRVSRKKDYITFIFKSKPTYDAKAKAVDVNNGMQTTKDVREYTQYLKVIDFFKLAETKPGYKESELTRKEIKEILQVADLQVFCDDPSFHWQGDNYVISLFDGSIYPTTIEPKHWRQLHNDDNFLCKHLSMIINSIDFFLNPMSSMINKYLKR